VKGGSEVATEKRFRRGGVTNSGRMTSGGGADPALGEAREQGAASGIRGQDGKDGVASKVRLSALTKKGINFHNSFETFLKACMPGQG